MTADLAISARGVGKDFVIGGRRDGPTRITEVLAQRLRHPLTAANTSTFTALDDVSFDIPWGEAVGIVGRNGAGKSTLLKLLTRISPPTRGEIRLGGRMGSLLEVGTGFHPELTGRENIHLNGTLLGMTRKEIARRFDDIVAFSGVERFLETPVKRYSSGMYVRLAFAVAAHLETEILAIDEVLAVGDAEFQRKSLDKMQQVAREGRAVLFVSHQVQTVRHLCTSAIFLDRGKLQFQGDVESALSAYRGTFDSFSAAQTDPSRRGGSGQLRFESVTVESETVEPADDKVVSFVVGDNPDVPGRYYVSCHVTDDNGMVIAQCDSRLTQDWFDPRARQEGQLTIRGLWLKPGRYAVDMFVCQSGVLDSYEAAGRFEVLPHLPYPGLADADGTSQGVIYTDFEYERAGA
jgi:lipopolysaccharide transport system ATP-binding protein